MIGNLVKAVDGWEDGGYPEIMKSGYRSASGLVGSLLLVSVLLLPLSVSANDYYSWIDANGTMVMTDDPSRVPPPTSRSQIQVHRFEPVPPSPPVTRSAEPASGEEPKAARPDAVDPRDLNLPPVVLAEPDNQVRAQYVWVPLLSPLFVGSNSVSGFWWHPGPTSPVEAFKYFLSQHYRQQQNQWAPGVGVPYPSSYNRGAAVRGASGSPVFDQVVRERQALNESIRLHFPGLPPPVQQVPRGGGGYHSLGTHAR